MLTRMVFYGQSGHCKWKVLLDNFGGAAGFGSCGSCDNCVRIAGLRGRRARCTSRDGNRVQADGCAVAAAPLPDRGELVRVPHYGSGVVDAGNAEASRSSSPRARAASSCRPSCAG